MNRVAFTMPDWLIVKDIAIDGEGRTRLRVKLCIRRSNRQKGSPITVHLNLVSISCGAFYNDTLAVVMVPCILHKSLLKKQHVLCTSLTYGKGYEGTIRSEIVWYKR